MRAMIIHSADELARGLQRYAHQTTDFQLCVAGRKNPLSADLRNSEFTYLPCRRKIDVPTILAIRKKIAEFAPDVIHTFEPRSLAQSIFARMGMRRKPKLISFYGITRVPSWHDPSNWLTYLSPSILLHTCESNAVKEALVQAGIRSDRCEVIYNCVTVSTPTLNKAQLLQKYNIPSEAFVLGSIATIRPVKGIDILLKAMIECSSDPRIYALIAGNLEDPNVETLRQDPRIRDRIRWLGYRENAASLVPAMDLFVMPSRREGLCRALLEAMWQSSCPVVSDAGGMKEIVRDGVDGVVFPSENVQALTTAIKHLAASPNLISRYGASAKERVANMCSSTVVCDRIIKIYQLAVSAAK